MNSKKRPSILFFKIAILSIFIGQGYLWIDRYTFNDLAMYDLRYKLQRIGRGENFDHIIFGDSVALAMRWNGPSDLYNYSLGYIGGFFPYRIWLQKYLAFNRPPMTLVFSAIPDTFTQEELFAISPRTLRLLPLSVTIKEVWRQRQWNEWPMILRKRFIAGNSLVAMLSGKIPTDQLDTRTGSVLFAKDGRYIFHPSAKKTFRISPCAAQQFDHFIREMHAHEIHLIIYSLPIPRSVYRDDTAYFLQVRQAMKSLARKYPGVTFCEPYQSRDLWADAFFCDASHLNEEGAKRWEKERFPELYLLMQKGRPETTAKRILHK